MYLRIYGVLRLQKNNWLRKSRKLCGPQIANSQIAALAGSSANITKKCCPQICGFAICGN
jgi:hypothetical protein